MKTTLEEKAKEYCAREKVCDTVFSVKGDTKYTHEILADFAREQQKELLEALEEMVAYETRCRAKGNPKIPEKYFEQAKTAIEKAQKL